MISREEARALAEKDALAHGLGDGVTSVVLPTEITGCGPLLYNVSLDGCWVAYISQPGPWGLRASTIVLVDREHGGIVYRGTANDEG